MQQFGARTQHRAVNYDDECTVDHRSAVHHYGPACHDTSYNCYSNRQGHRGVWRLQDAERGAVRDRGDVR